MMKTLNNYEKIMKDRLGKIWKYKNGSIDVGICSDFVEMNIYLKPISLEFLKTYNLLLRQLSIISN